MKPERSPEDRLARIAGALLILMATAAGASEDLRQSLVIETLTSRELTIGFFGYLVAFACDVPVTIIFYLLTRQAGVALAMTAAAFRLVYTAAVVAILVFFYAAAVFVRAGVDPKLAAASLEIYKYGFNAALVLFGCHLILLGISLERSLWLRRGFGRSVSIAGVAYIVGTTVLFIDEALHARIVRYLAVPMMAELVLGVWLVFKGAERSRTTPASA